MQTYKILVVDDEHLVRNSMKRLLDQQDWRILLASNMEEALSILNRQKPDVIIIDYKLGSDNGMELLERVVEGYPDTVPIMLTAYGNIALAVEAVKKGAYDFLQKDGDPELLRHVVAKALEKVRLRKEVERLQTTFLRKHDVSALIGESPAMKEVLAMADRFAQGDCTILLEGETGTGKSLVAEYIHYRSERREGPFITINCGAIPRELIESELFGYEKGAFTGANTRGKAGLISQADQGTLFLDEISDLAVELQSKLLYVLESGEILPVGGVQPHRVDVRFIAATNADLQTLMQENRFRQDLFYRLNVANIRIPPLRERKEDILPLTKMFLNQFNRKFHKSVYGLSSAAQAALLNHSWPGNVRELRNLIERIVLLSTKELIDVEDLAPLLGPPRPSGHDALCCVEIRLGQGENVLQQAQAQLVKHAWQRSEKNQTLAARLLGIPRTTLQHYLQKYRLI